MMRYRVIRNFLRSPGVDVLTGAIIECDADEGALLLALQAAVPVTAKHVTYAPRVEWGPPPVEPHIKPSFGQPQYESPPLALMALH